MSRTNHHAPPRRHVLALTTAALASCARRRGSSESSLDRELAAIRARIGGRLGVYAVDTASGRQVAFDARSRYAMASTFKLPLAAAVLAQVDAGRIALDQTVAVTAADMVSHAPVTSAHLARGVITVETLCAAVVEVSDNPAANLLLRLLGGPGALTAWLRSIGDDATRLDRVELELNTNLPGDARDTTTPFAMAQTVRRVVLGDVLTARSRARLAEWLVRCETGARRLRAGLPRGWRAGDKTGSGANGAVNDVAVVWPPAGGALVMAVYLSESSQPPRALEAAHAEIARHVVRALGR